MRETIGGTWLTQLIIAFMFVFVAFLALSINYSKAFRVKNEVLSIIEKHDGINNDTIKTINNYLKNNGHIEMGSCPNGSYGIIINGINNYEPAVSNKRYNYCISKLNSNTLNFPKRSYYDVKLFLKFNLPIIGNITTFPIEGQTKDISYPIDDGIIKYKSKLQNNS